VIIGIIHVNRKKGRPSQCRICKEDISAGEVHAVVIMRYGKGQEAVFKLRATQGKAMTKKSGLKYRRLHLKDCLAMWLVTVYHYRSEARRERKGGRPPLPIMDLEEKSIRHKLVRRRAEVLRQINAADDNTRIVKLAHRLEEIQDKLEIPVTPPHERNLHRRMILGKVDRKITVAKEEQS